MCILMLLAAFRNSVPSCQPLKSFHAADMPHSRKEWFQWSCRKSWVVGVIGPFSAFVGKKSLYWAFFIRWAELRDYVSFRRQPEAIHKLHAPPMYVEGEVVLNDLFDPGGVGFTQHHQVFHLALVACSFLTIWNQADYWGIICKFYYDVWGGGSGRRHGWEVWRELGSTHSTAGLLCSDKKTSWNKSKSHE